jgi:acetyltransferase-like isoleucine patch superfamily enzyme
MARKIIRKIFGGIHEVLDPISAARKQGVKIGEGCRLIKVDFGSEPYLITLGDNVSVIETRFVTHDGGVWIFRGKEPEIDVIAPIRIGNNVFIGLGTIILPGVEVGDNVVIGAGSVVTKNIPSDTVAAGVPAKRIETVEEYRSRLEALIVRTKQLTAEKKKAFLKRHFEK